ncbi:MAG: hypothetical protein V3U24_08355 [Candidatus Neomarinimicrobiota bacterium]
MLYQLSYGGMSGLYSRRQSGSYVGMPGFCPLSYIGMPGTGQGISAGYAHLRQVGHTGTGN